MNGGDWADADPVVTAAVLAVNQFQVSAEHKLEALRAAYEAVKACAELEQELSRRNYVAAAAGLVKVTDKCV